MISIGAQFSRFVVLAPSTRKKYFLCKCSCGSQKEVRQDHLLSGKTKSCGCLGRELASARISKVHAAAIKHGASTTRAYSTWHSMRQRCENPNSRHFHRYGGRGIEVCARWKIFDNFLADMGQPPNGLTIERIDNNLGYSPDNCRWASRKQQQNNRNVNRFVTWKGKTQTASQWSDELGIPANTIHQRLDRGLPAEEVLSSVKKRDVRGLALGAVASKIARLSRTHCKHGHEYTPENTYVTSTQRSCRICHKLRQRARNAQKPSV